MSKELEALHNLYARASVHCPIDEISIILNELHIIEKTLKALEIIKEKNLCLSIDWQPWEKDGDYRAWDNELYQSVKLTKEEYELLKEILK